MMGSQKVQLIDLRFGYGMKMEGNVVHQSEDAADGCCHHRPDPLLNEEFRWMKHQELLTIFVYYYSSYYKYSYFPWLKRASRGEQRQ
jgi:hypothetical protein